MYIFFWNKFWNLDLWNTKGFSWFESWQRLDSLKSTNKTQLFSGKTQSVYLVFKVKFTLFTLRAGSRVKILTFLEHTCRFTMAKTLTTEALSAVNLYKHDKGSTSGADILPSGNMTYSLVVFLRNFAWIAWWVKIEHYNG